MNQANSLQKMIFAASCSFLMLILFFSFTFSQNRTWTIKLHTPSANTLSLKDIWSLDIVNHEPEPVEVVLFGEVFEADKGDVFRGRSNTLILPSGGKTTTSSEVIQIVDRWSRDEYQNAIEGTEPFPEGNYNICITVITTATGQELGADCVQHRVNKNGEPGLVLPLEGMEIQERYPFFRWTEPGSISSGSRILYRIRIFEVYRGQTPAEACNNIAFFEADGIDSTGFSYPLQGLRFEDGKQYVWQVQALDPQGNPVAESKAWSNARTFKYKAPLMVGKEKLQALLPDTLSIGSFKLILDKETARVSEGRLSGKASGQFLTPPPCASASTTSTGLSADEFATIYINGPQVYSANDFEVEFSDLQLENWPPQKTEKVVQGRIDHSFSSPLKLVLDDFTVHIQKLSLEGDSTRAALEIYPDPSYLCKSISCSPLSFAAKDVAIDRFARFYFSQTDFSADSLIIGNTGIMISVRGLEAKFKQSPYRILFSSGVTIAQETTYPNNSDFLFADYSFSKGEIIACEGFHADMLLRQPWEYETLLPTDFRVKLYSGNLTISKSWVDEGSFSATITLPKSIVNTAKSRIEVAVEPLYVDSLLNLSGTAALSKREKICWGGFTLSTDSAAVFIPGSAGEFSFAPLDTTTSSTYTQMDQSNISKSIETIPGLTFNLLHPDQVDTLTVLTPDCKSPLLFPLHKTYLCGWLNASTKGMTGELLSREKLKLLDVNLGLLKKEGYKSDATFAASVIHEPDSLFWVDLQFVRNAVYNSYIGGRLTIPYPCDIRPKFKDLEVTSTAELVGGDVFFKSDTLQYWGVPMTAEETGNVLSVDTGEIIYMNSSIEEKIHFTKSFRIIWGEMLAHGDLGKFLFDYNCAGQKFDGFPLTLHKASLSKYVKSKGKALQDTLGYLRSYGDVHFNFFGAKRMDLYDYKDARAGHKASPYFKRFVKMDKSNSNTHFDKNWGGSTARMVFDVDYDNLESGSGSNGDQNGFKGITSKTMKVDLNLTAAIAKAQTITPEIIDLNSRTSFISFCSGTKTSAGAGEAVKLVTGTLVNKDIAYLNEIGGIIQIQGDAIKRICIEGHTNLDGWKFAQHSLSSLEITPSYTRLKSREQITLTAFSFGFLGITSTTLILDKTDGSLDGDISGIFQMYGGVNFVIDQSYYAEMEARGRFNFHISPTANYVQGYGKIKVKFRYDVECEGAFFLGYNAPTDKIWALDQITRGKSIRTILTDMGANTLTGIYFAGEFGLSINWKIISGGADLWAGSGFFKTDDGTYFVGHGGVEVNISLLGGLLSASAFAEVLTATGISATSPYFHLCMQGTIGIKACACHICVNWQSAFYIDDTIGFGLGDGCYGTN